MLNRKLPVLRWQMCINGKFARATPIPQVQATTQKAATHLAPKSHNQPNKAIHTKDENRQQKKTSRNKSYLSLFSFITVLK